MNYITEIILMQINSHTCLQLALPTKVGSLTFTEWPRPSRGWQFHWKIRIANASISPGDPTWADSGVHLVSNSISRPSISWFRCISAGMSSKATGCIWRKSETPLIPQSFDWLLTKEISYECRIRDFRSDVDMPLEIFQASRVARAKSDVRTNQKTWLDIDIRGWFLSIGDQVRDFHTTHKTSF